MSGADPEGGAPGAPPPPPPLKLKKNMIFWRKIVIFSHEIPQKSWIRPCMCHVGKNVTQMCL